MFVDDLVQVHLARAWPASVPLGRRALLALGALGGLRRGALLGFGAGGAIRRVAGRERVVARDVGALPFAIEFENLDVDLLTDIDNF